MQVNEGGLTEGAGKSVPKAIWEAAWESGTRGEIEWVRGFVQTETWNHLDYIQRPWAEGTNRGAKLCERLLAEIILSDLSSLPEGVGTG